MINNNTKFTSEQYAKAGIKLLPNSQLFKSDYTDDMYYFLLSCVYHLEEIDQQLNQAVNFYFFNKLNLQNVTEWESILGLPLYGEVVPSNLNDRRSLLIK